MKLFHRSLWKAMKRMKNNKKRRFVKPSRLVFLIVLLASNTLAWFIYATKVDTNVSVHVRAWNVVFEAGENEVSNIINIPVDSIYPGMSDYSYEINAYNRSEVNATMSYQVLSATLLGTEILSVEEKTARGLQIDEDNDLTAAELEASLADDYPFSITMETSSSTIVSQTGIETFTLGITWPYESNQDDIDTLWGSNAYTYKESYPTLPSIALKVKITITQSNS